MLFLPILAVFSMLPPGAPASKPAVSEQLSIQAIYDKFEYMIPMRDGVKLYTAVYVPKRAGSFPIILERTPYSCQPYGPDAFPGSMPGSPKFVQAGTIFAFQDVRGQFMSGGTFEDIRPLLAKHETPQETDESTDADDTISWLVKHVPRNNGNVGTWGTSYPGFYAACTAICGNPALKIASPQAPVTDWFHGDDFHHNGALFVQDGFEFYNFFGYPRIHPYKNWAGSLYPLNYSSSYDFYLHLGSPAHIDVDLLKGQVPFWTQVMQHPNWGAFWKKRTLIPFLTRAKCAILEVGGLYDAEDMYGPLHQYAFLQGLKRSNARIVMGPWFHGMWLFGTGEGFGGMDFGSPTSQYFRDHVEFPLFEHYLTGAPMPDEPQALMFSGGSDKWMGFKEWPPKNGVNEPVYIQPNGTLAIDGAPANLGSRSYVSDPMDPVPYQGGILTRRTRSYMIADQSFDLKRPDVLTYDSAPLERDIQVAGTIKADLVVSSSTTDSDFVVKLIDVFPPDDPSYANQHRLVRWDIFPARFRKSFSHPEPLKPGVPVHLRFELNSDCYRFLQGHRMEIQIQSTMFPLIGRNPQQFEPNPYIAPDSAFTKATETVYAGSKITLEVMPDAKSTGNR